jgi:predicted ferric reductase
MPLWQRSQAAGGQAGSGRPLLVGPPTVVTPITTLCARPRYGLGPAEGHGVGPAEMGADEGTAKLEEGNMLWTIFVILLVLWLLGVVTSYTLGGFIHVLLIVAVILAIMQLISGRRAV